MTTDFDAIQAAYNPFEKHLGTQKVTTGAFAYEMRQFREALRDLAFGDSMNLDAFGRLRVSNPYTLFDGKTLKYNHPNDWDDVEATGTGTSTWFDEDRSATGLIVSLDEAGTRVRQTYRRFSYTPGKSQLAFLTFVHGDLEPEVSRKIGLFDDNNGVFLDTEGPNVYLTIRSSVTGATVDGRVSKTDWNIDQFDGNGPSGIVLDLTKAQILVIDYEWLGVGRVRVGFNVDGVTYPAHQFKHANVVDSVYMTTPNLPLRYEIESDGTGTGDKIGGSAVLEAICSTVISEGGEDPIGRQWGAASAGIQSGINGTGADRYALAGLRVKSSAADTAVVQPSDFFMVGATVNDEFAWEIVLGGTVAGAPSWTGYTNSVAEYFLGTSANTITGGTILQTGVAFSRDEISINPRNLPGPGVAYDGTPQHLHFVIRPFSNMQAAVAINWVER